MMFLKRVLSLFLICLGLVFVSCSDMEGSDEGSLSLTFNGSDFLDSSARDIYPDSSFNGMYIVASVLGDYTETKKLEITNAGKYKIKFDYVPKGASVYVRADVFRLNSIEATGASVPTPFKHIYTGQSKKKTVSMKNEKVSLVMKNIGSGCNYSDYNTYYNLVGTPTFRHKDYDYISSSPSIYLFNNGKYQVLKYNYDSGSNELLSEGLWSGNLDECGYIYITELIYSDFHINDDNEVVITGNYVMPEPKTRPCWREYHDEPGDSLTIDLLSGLSFMCVRE